MSQSTSSQKSNAVDPDIVLDMLARLQKVFDTIEMKIDVVHKETSQKSDKEKIRQALEHIHHIQE